MPYKDFSVGEVLTANDVNTYLMQQSIAVVTSGTRPNSPVQGQMIYETDTQSLVLYTGSVWETLVYHGPFKTYVPAWTASGTNPSIGNGGLSAQYRRLPGRMVWVRLSWSRGSTTNFGSGTYSFSLPPGLPAEVGTRWFGDVYGSPDNANYQVRGIATILAGGSGENIDRISWDISDTAGGAGDMDNWTSTTQSNNEPQFDVDGYFTVNLMYETTYIESDEEDA
ncbi:hypothetical protein [Streptomonospora arabica]|uniref:Uncharacterized protein n=1 Tax=Streptomonospora arabica TaxID=412417 RepID=A0ABV9SSL3_9ACTN